MDISIVPVSRIFKTYQGQARIAELNKKNPVKRVQTQRDRVSISQDARAALTAHTQGGTPKLETSAVQAEAIDAGNNEASATGASADESFSRTSFAE